MIEIPLTQGKVALIDDEDYELVSQYKWHAHVTFSGQWYAKARSGKISMHRLLMNPPAWIQVDHVNSDGLDNRRENLRLATSKQQSYNKRPQKNKMYSKYKGVCWDASRSKWVVYIHHQGRQIYLGRFTSELDAAKAYDDAAKERFGEFSRTNF